MTTVTNSNDPLLNPDGSIAEASAIEFQLVSTTDLQPCEGWSTGNNGTIVTTTVTALTNPAGLFSVDLWPTSLLYPAVVYRVRSRSGLFRMFYASLGEASPTTLKTLRISQIPLTSAELSALETHLQSGQHLPPGGSTGQSLVKVGDASYAVGWSNVAGSGGDLSNVVVSIVAPANPVEGMVWVQIPA